MNKELKNNFDDNLDSKYIINSIVCKTIDESKSIKTCKINSSIEFSKPLKFVDEFPKNSNNSDYFGLNNLVDFFKNDPLKNSSLVKTSTVTSKKF